MTPYTPNTDPTLLQLFPGPATLLGRGGNEVNGLDADAVPQGKILGSAMSKFESDRVFHVVDCNEERLYLRVCKTMPGEGYDAFAVIHDRAALGSAMATNMLERYKDSVEHDYFLEIPTTILPTIENGASFRAQSIKPSASPNLR